MNWTIFFLCYEIIGLLIALGIAKSSENEPLPLPVFLAWMCEILTVQFWFFISILGFIIYLRRKKVL